MERIVNLIACVKQAQKPSIAENEQKEKFKGEL
jgi:hypothetical protein